VLWGVVGVASFPLACVKEYDSASFYKRRGDVCKYYVHVDDAICHVTAGMASLQA
jgi:hypothetical protein